MDRPRMPLLWPTKGNVMHQEIIVAKFGGSSMADAKAMSRSAQVAIKHQAQLVVVSATYGTTNELIKLSQCSEKGEWSQCEEIIEHIKEKHQQIALELGLNTESERLPLEELFFDLATLARGINLLKECTPKAFDSIQSLGERMSSLLFTKALQNALPHQKVELFDVRNVLITDDQFGRATPDIAKIKIRCSTFLSTQALSEKIFVTQGFIGQSEEGHTTTLGRGGSDYSAALLAEGIGAQILQIWTDVAGIATTDPNIVKEAKAISEITYSEAAELAVFGAKILHPTTLTPALRGDVSVFVGSSYDAEKKGTWIVKDCAQGPLVRAMAIRKTETLLTFSTPKMLNSHGFLYDIFKIFKHHRISVDSVTTSEISVSLTIDDPTKITPRLMAELREMCDVKKEEDLALVSLIGNNIHHTPGFSARVFGAIQDINVRMICFGASKHNFCFLVAKHDAERAISLLHKEFIS